MIQNYDATPQIFLSGRILKAIDFDYKEMFVKVIFDLKIYSNLYLQFTI